MSSSKHCVCNTNEDVGIFLREAPQKKRCNVVYFSIVHFREVKILPRWSVQPFAWATKDIWCQGSKWWGDVLRFKFISRQGKLQARLAFTSGIILRLWHCFRSMSLVVANWRLLQSHPRRTMSQPTNAWWKNKRLTFKRFTTCANSSHNNLVSANFPPSATSSQDLSQYSAGSS